MLIKKSIVEKWYQTDSWVYKNFAYLFQNPLWTKRVPNGFSVCPYFWMNMFSLLVFRPFIVFPIQYFLLPIMRFIGKPARVVDEGIFKLLTRLLNGNGTYVPAMGLLGGIVFLFLIALALAVILVTGIKTYDFYNYLTLTHAGTFVFWSMASFASLFGVIAIHKGITKTSCKTMYYLFVWLVLFIPAAGLIVPAESGGLITDVAGSVGHILAQVGLAIWYGLVVAATWAWLGIKVLVTWKPIEVFMLPWWGYFILLGVIGWIVSKSTVYVEERNINTLREENPAELYAKFRATWLEIMVRIVMVGKKWKSGEVFHDHFDNYTADALMTFSPKCLRDSIEQLCSKELDELQKHYPMLKEGVWEQIAKPEQGTESRFEMYKYGLVDGSDVFPIVNINTLIMALRSVVAKDINVKLLADAYREKDAKQQAKKAAKNTSWGHVTCLKFTTGIADTVHNVGRGLKTIGSNTVTFTAYMWMLAKAKKQGACPYFKFAAPVVPTAPSTTTSTK